MTDTLILLAGLIQTKCGLPDGSVFLFNQKVDPKVVGRPGMFVCLQTIGVKAYGPQMPSYRWDGVQYWEDTAITKSELIQIDIFSRNFEAQERYMDVVATFGSYATNELSLDVGMKIQLLPDIVTVSQPDGEAIPYRYILTLRVNRLYTSSIPMPWFDNGFLPVQVVPDP
jgi:hypothetical protein